MKKQLLSLIIALMTISLDSYAGVAVSSSIFPDQAFRERVSYILDWNNDGFISDEEIEFQKNRDFSWAIFYGCSSLQGLQYLPCFKLVVLRECSETLTIVTNEYLEDLQIYDSPLLTSISFLPETTASTRITIRNTSISSLDVSATSLRFLSVIDAPLSNISVNTTLEHLDIGSTSFTFLDLSASTSLKELELSNTPLNSLDLSANTFLEKLSIYNTPLTSFDLSANTSLKELSVKNTPLASLDLSSNTSLLKLEIANTPLTELDVSECKELKYFDCSSNQLTELDVSECTKLEELHCTNNQLIALNVTGCTVLEYLYCFCNQLTELDVTGCAFLDCIHCYSNQIDEASMRKLVNSLPYAQALHGDVGRLFAIDTADKNERNVINTVQVRDAKRKRWYTMDWNGDEGDRLYPGTASASETDMHPLGEDVTITFSNESNLMNVVIDDVYYNLTGENGYDETEKCIVINTTSEVDTVYVPGLDLNFAGLIFEVDGSGLIEIDCQTIGINKLNVKVGDEEPQTFNMDERGKVQIHFDVKEPTYVYIYATAEASANATRRATASENCVKIWSLTFGSDITLGIGLSERNTKSTERYYTLDGQMLSVKPNSPGVYVVGGRKVVVK